MAEGATAIAVSPDGTVSATVPGEAEPTELGQIQVRGDERRWSLTPAGDAELAAAFGALTPGRQRQYNLYISDAKQSTTRASRVERCVPKILQSKGFRDR